jgi:hypothetical protein
MWIYLQDHARPQSNCFSTKRVGELMFIPVALVFEVYGCHISSFITRREIRVLIKNNPVFSPNQKL